MGRRNETFPLNHMSVENTKDTKEKQSLNVVTTIITVTITITAREFPR